MRRLYYALPVLLFCLLALPLTGCDSSDDTSLPRIGGSYTFEASSASLDVTYTGDVTLTHPGGDVRDISGAGRASVVGFDATIPFDVAGTQTDPDILMTWDTGSAIWPVNVRREENGILRGSISFPDGSTLDITLRP